jgi:hypothetical protein
MSYQHPDQEAEHRTRALVEAVNSALRDYYDKAKTEHTKRIAISVSHGVGGKSRTPEQQASYLLKHTSWTANSAHMADGAKHILVRQGGAVQWKLNEVKHKDQVAFGIMVKAWNEAMKTQNLRNYRGGQTFDHPGSDPLHMELPNSRLRDDDPRVVKTLEIYAKATRVDGHPRNMAFEVAKGSEFQKRWLRAYDQKLTEEKLTKGAP